MARGGTNWDGHGGEGGHGPQVEVGVVVLGVAVAGVDLHGVPLGWGEPGKLVPDIWRVDRGVRGGGVEADVLVINQGLIAPVMVMTFRHRDVSARWEGVRGFVCLFV